MKSERIKKISSKKFQDLVILDNRMLLKRFIQILIIIEVIALGIHLGFASSITQALLKVHNIISIISFLLLIIAIILLKNDYYKASSWLALQIIIINIILKNIFGYGDNILYYLIDVLLISILLLDRRENLIQIILLLIEPLFFQYYLVPLFSKYNFTYTSKHQGIITNPFIFILVTSFFIILVMNTVIQQNTQLLKTELIDRNYQAIMEQASEGIFISDIEGNYLEVNKAGLSMLGYSEKEILNLSVSKIIDPNDLKETPLKKNELLLGKIVKLERKFVKKDGSIIQCYVSARMMEDGRVLAIFRDISDKKEAEKQRAKVLKKLRIRETELLKLITAIEQSPSIVVITDIDGNIEYVNPKFCQLTGYSRKEALSKNPSILKSGYTTKEEYEHLWQTILSGQEWEGEFKNKKKDGSNYWAAVTIAPVIDGNGKIINFIAVQKDITQQKEIEEQLFQIQKMQAIGRLASGIAHDFNNILTGIIGYSEMLLEQNTSNSEIYDDVNEIKKAALRASSLTNQLLTFSRKQSIHTEIFDINELVRDMQKMLSRLLTNKITLDVQLSGMQSLIKADPNKIEQLIMNLVVNANDAIQDFGEICIKIENITIQELIISKFGNIIPNNYVKISVKDNGCGIEKKQLDYIFDPFYTTKENGTGLGLSIVFGITKQSEAHIIVSSSINLGTEIEILFPSMKPESQTKSMSMEITEETDQSALILLVEDDDVVRPVIRRILISKGYEVISVDRPDKALALFNQLHSEIDLVISDVIMPEMSGLELIQLFQKLESELKILIISAYPEKRDEGDFKWLNNNNIEFLAKPFEGKELFKKINKLLYQYKKKIV